jgi:folate-binding Fe-S cluster repair protein YgfZ
VGGVSFNKGCYVGQEIIARMQFLGRLKQRMYRLHAMVDTVPQRGEAIYAPDFPGQPSGSVVDAQPSPDGGYDMLAVVHISSAEAGELYLGRERGPRLTVQALPYPLTSAQ